MCRSSRLTLFVLSIVLLPNSASAQFYGFPSEVGVVDDGFGVLPPLPPLPPPEFVGGPPPLTQPPVPPSPPHCPVVIEVGRGLKQTARTRVIYGRPNCS